ncbi:Amino-acid acetyltransferase, mitochondrial [Kappamyces sp. JEL0829]|nr:Amino-acid acetyltransferase, mitochondrial [Kappamyces sp. JEL0829]
MAAVASKQTPIDPSVLLSLLCKMLSHDKLGAPIKFIVINKKGGVLNPAFPFTHTGFINLTPEYHRTWKSLDKDSFSSLAVIHKVLDQLPATSSAILASAHGQASVIANLLTEKAPPSYGAQALDEGGPVPPTMFRRGLALQTFETVGDAGLDLARLYKLLETSFGRKIDPAYWKRLEQTLFFITIAGDYDGALIVTKEGVDGLVYLDKFAVSPTSQGLGVADLLWAKLATHSDVFWRSRKENPVNKWYFERADGHIVDGAWTTFWFGSQGLEQLQAYTKIAAGIPASFLK